MTNCHYDSCQVCLTLTGGGANNFAIFQKMDPTVGHILELGFQIPEHPEWTTKRVSL